MRVLCYAVLVCSVLAAVGAGGRGLIAAERSSVDVDISSISIPGPRTIVDARKPPWRAVGRLNKAGRGFCTAFLVRPSWIATAAHCLWNPDTGRYFSPADLHFLAGYQRERFLAHGRGQQLVINPKYRPGRTPEPENEANDWAFVRLNKPIGNQVGFFEIAPMSAAELVDLTRKSGKDRPKLRIAQAGYSKDFRYVITANLNCRLGRVAKFDLVAHNCEVLKGDSGSPVLLFSGEDIRVVALHVATGTRGEVRFGLAVPGSAFGETGLNLDQESKR